MTVPDGKEPKSETLKLFPKKYPPLVMALAIFGVVLAIAFAAYVILSAMEEPKLPRPPMIR